MRWLRGGDFESAHGLREGTAHHLSDFLPTGSLCLPRPCRDKHRGFQLYQSDPSGNYSGWKATSIGANHQSAANVLQGDYSDDVCLEDAVKMVVKVLSKTMDSTTLSPEKVELSTISLDSDGRVAYRIYERDALQPVLDAVNAEQAAEKEREARGAA